MLLREFDQVGLLSETVCGTVPSAGGVVLAWEERVRVRKSGLRLWGAIPRDMKFARDGFC